MNTKWVVRDYDAKVAADLSRALGLPQTLGRILAGRGFNDADAVRRFLNPSLADMHDPYLLSGMRGAVERITAAVTGGERIVIYGDYDVDGATSTALLVHLFDHLEANCTRFIPNRFTDGYGVNAEAVERLIAGGARLIITCDCGVSSVAEIARANALGVDVIVCDHHEPPAELPPAHAILNPKLAGERYPFRDLAAVGVAYKLACALASHLGLFHDPTESFKAELRDMLALVAIGSVADVVPLVGENRILVLHGCAAVAETPNPGIRALREVCRLPGGPVESWHIGFQLAPRLNAGGRMGNSDLAVSLLTCRSYDEAIRIAEILESENLRRRAIEQDIVREATRQIQELYGDSPSCGLVLSSAGWHRGVIGIVAQRISETFYCPTAIVSCGDQVARGSARSIGGVSLPEVLAECSELLLRYGGHDFAAGFDLPLGRLDEFRTRFGDAVARRIGKGELTPESTIDAEDDLSAMTPELAYYMSRLAPFGRENRQPVLATHDLEVVGVPGTMGKMAQHLQFHVRQNGVAARVVGFNLGHLIDEVTRGRRVSVAYKLQVNEWSGTPEVELHAQEIKFG